MQEVVPLLRPDSSDSVAAPRQDQTSKLGQGFAYSKLLCNLNAIGASGSMMVLTAFFRLTSIMAFLVTFLVVDDFAPNVATSLLIIVSRFARNMAHGR